MIFTQVPLALGVMVASSMMVALVATILMALYTREFMRLFWWPISFGCISLGAVILNFELPVPHGVALVIGNMAVLGGVAGLIVATNQMLGKPSRYWIVIVTTAAVGVMWLYFALASSPLSARVVAFSLWSLVLLCGLAWSLTHHLSTHRHLIGTTSLIVFGIGVVINVARLVIVSRTNPSSELGNFVNNSPGYYAIALASWTTVMVAIIAGDQMQQHLAQQVSQANELQRELYEYSTTDALTQIGNRNLAEQVISDLRQLARTSAEPVSLVLVDIDRFARVNTNYGHKTGDTVITLVAAHLQQLARPGDVLSRWRGEQFLMVLPNTDLGTAEVLGRCYCRAIEQGELPIASHLTASAGVAQLDPAEQTDEFLHRADEALRAAKAKGRNCVVALT